MKTQIPTDYWGGKRLIWLLALLLALAVAPSMLRAQEWDRLNRRHEVHDPTGAWLLKWDVDFGFGRGLFAPTVFHQGGTLTGDLQGESAFDPTTTTDPTSNLNVITTPHSGVWQKRGWDKFVATFLVLEYHVQSQPPGAPLFQLTKVQYDGKLIGSNKMTLKIVVTHYDANGKFLDQSPEFNAKGQRILLEKSASTDNLPIPDVPPVPTETN